MTLPILSAPSHLMLAEVILPLGVRQTFTYLIPMAWHNEAQVGMRVMVQFGKSKRYFGLIISLRMVDEGSLPKKLKAIEALPDREPIATPEEIANWQWAAEYYMAPLFSFVKLAIPFYYFPESSLVVYWKENICPEESLSPMAYRIRNELVLAPMQRLKVSTLEERLGREAYSEIGKLLKIGVVSAEEVLSPRKKNLGVAHISFDPVWLQAVEENPDLMPSKRAAVQKQMIVDMMAYLENHPEGLKGDVPENLLVKGNRYRTETIKILQKKGIVRRQFRVPENLIKTPNLLDEANESLPEANLDARTPRVAILGSSVEQMEFVLNYIAPWMKHGNKNVLVLMPHTHSLAEIELYRSAFEERGWDSLYDSYTSASSPQERMQIRSFLTKGLRGKCLFGGRNTALLPLEFWDLIVVTHEENDNYRNSMSEPYFSAVDYLLACKAKETPICLSTTTPRAELLYLIRENKYHLLYQSEKIPIRQVEVVDLKKARKSRKMAPDQQISPELRSAILNTLERKKDVILVVNRKGYARSSQCPHCSSSILCPHCDVHLAYHKSHSKLVCHYCGYKTRAPQVCPTCGTELEHLGFGVERIAEEVQHLAPDAEIHSIESKDLLPQGPRSRIPAMERIASTQPKVWVSTHAISSVMTLREVGLIGCLNLNAWTALPDFRANERAWSIWQRISDNYPESDMIIQTYEPEHPLVGLIGSPNRLQCAQNELQERELLNFPPMVRMAYIYAHAPKESESNLFIRILMRKLSQHPDLFSSAEGPIIPLVSQVNLHFVRYLCVRFHRHASWREIRQVLDAESEAARKKIGPSSSRIRVVFEIDPL